MIKGNKPIANNGKVILFRILFSGGGKRCIFVRAPRTETREIIL